MNDLLAYFRYIAKTLYGEQDEDTASEDNTRSMEEPTFLGVHPSSNEKVFLLSSID